MKDWVRFILYFINLIIYAGITALWIANPFDITLNVAVTVFNLCFSILVIYYDRKRFVHFYTSSKFSKFVSALMGTFLVFCILALVNYLSYKHPAKLDFSKDKRSSLTEKSIELIKSLDSDKEFTFMVFSRKKEFSPIAALLKLYPFHKSNTIIDFIDVELRPDIVKKNGINRSGTIVVKYNGRQSKVSNNSELGIANAIIKVTRKKDPVVYYTTGHSGLDMEGPDENGLSRFFTTLKKRSYKVLTINLMESSKIPDDADALIIWGPKLGFLHHEVDLLEDYLKRGGSILAALDPDMNNDRLRSLREFFSKRGIKIRNNLVIDTASHVSGSKGSVPLVKIFDKQHQITSKFQGPVFLPLASSIQKVPGNDLGELTLVALTSFFPNSWAENSPKEEMISDKVTFNEGVDEQVPVALAGAWEGNVSNDRIFILGNSTLISNVYSNYGMNFDFVLNALGWLVDRDSLASFNLPIGRARPVFITSTQMGIVFYFSVVMVPLLMFAAAVYLYLQRKKF